MAGPYTRTGDFSEIPVTGRPFSIQGVAVVIWQNGKFVRESHCYGMAEVYYPLHIKEKGVDL